MEGRTLTTVEDAIEAVNHWGEWQTFWTGTFADVYSIGAAQRAFERTMSTRSLKNTSYLYTIELHKRAGAHLHALFDCHTHKLWDTLRVKWLERYGRNRLEKPRNSVDTKSYVTKYMVKEWNEETGNIQTENWWNVHLSRTRRRELDLPTAPSGSGGSLPPVVDFELRDFVSARSRRKAEREAFDWKWGKMNGLYPRYRKPSHAMV